MELLTKKSYRGPLRAVVLDWAGTTIDYGCCAPVAAFCDAFKSMGVEVSVEEARRPMGAHKKDHIREIIQDESVAKRWQKKHGRAATEADVETIFKEFVQLQLKTLAYYADLIPGTLEAVAEFRKRKFKIGTTTGYTGEMMEIIKPEAKRRGYAPDATVAATEVPAGRPHPFMCFQNAILLQTYPMEAYVKIGDTVPDIEEGLNAGMWTVGVVKTGNEMGFTEKELAALEPSIRDTKLKRARERMRNSGAHFVVDGISDVIPLLDEIEKHLSRGERP